MNLLARTSRKTPVNTSQKVKYFCDRKKFGVHSGVFQSEIILKPAAIGVEMMCEGPQAGTSHETNGSTAGSRQHP